MNEPTETPAPGPLDYDRLIPHAAGPLEISAAISYHRHYGEGSVEAAETDQLGRALESLAVILALYEDAKPRAASLADAGNDCSISRARAILARATGAKP